MRNGALLLGVCGAAVANAWNLDFVPVWRQVLFVVLIVAAYLHGRHLPVRRGWALIGLAAVPPLVAAPWSLPVTVGVLPALGLFVTLPWLAGRFQLQQADRLASLEREQEFVRLRERARIAADMHDSLGHDLALMALRAGALELAPEMTDANRHAATELRESAVAATDRLRNTLDLLREPGAAPLPPSLSELLDRARSAGLTVHHTGPDSTDPTVHRVVQESLTNASRHAPGAEVELTVTRSPTHTTLRIQNPSPGTRGASSLGVDPAGRRGASSRGADPAGTRGASSRGTDPAGTRGASSRGTDPAGTPGALSQGTGLAGLHERVTLLGGTFTTTHADGTFTVTAEIPA
ncbi:sensor histidine kinase [Actinoplanes sp. NPDC049265]|uniref:sensor histidine kinase n=1 Tax=Actinoplanes sp. NPDC049265 TaxID=3363902 RepID=UPI003713F705